MPSHRSALCGPAGAGAVLDRLGIAGRLAPTLKLGPRRLGSRELLTMIDRVRRALLCSVAATAALAATPSLAQVSSDQQLVVDRARIVVESFLNDTDFAKMRVYVQNAY